jgi:hypothetical protein
MAEDTKKEKAPSDSEPNWKVLESSRTYEISLRKAVAASCNFEDAVLDGPESQYPAAEVLAKFHDRMQVAFLAGRTTESGLNLRWILDDDGVEIAMVRLDHFVGWTVRMKQRGYPLWDELDAKFQELAEERPLLWPWGRYTTTLLDALREAVEKFWKNQDPNAKPNKDKDPSKAVVVKHFSPERVPFVSETSAKAIDKIIRHNLSGHVTHRDKKPPPPTPKKKSRVES